MSSSTDAPRPDSFPPELREQIDELLDAFERDRQAGGTSPITAFLEQIPSLWRGAVFGVLLRAECEYLADTDRVPDISAYFDRYPEFHAILREVFCRDEATRGPCADSARPCSGQTDCSPPSFAESVAKASLAAPSGTLGGNRMWAETRAEPALRCGNTESPRIAIVGGGWAGLAAAVTAVEQGFRVELFEARGRCGGRAGLTVSLAGGVEVDFCRHVVLGCCTNWLDLIARTGCAERLSPPEETYRFVSRAGQVLPFRAGRMPSPLHLWPALFSRTDLSFATRWGIGSALMRLARSPGRCDQTFAAWLAEQGQTPQAIAGFWTPVVISALSDDIAHVSQAAARQVFVDGLLASAGSGRMIFARRTMDEVIQAVVRWLESREVIIHHGTVVRSVQPAETGVIVRARGGDKRFDYAVSAVPWWQVERLLCFPEPSATWEDARAILRRATELPVGAIAAVHLVYRRHWARAAHAVLIDRLGQWFFSETADSAAADTSAAGAPRMRGVANTAPSSRIAANRREETVGEPLGCYQVVISGMHRQPDVADTELIAKVRRELGAIWPDEAESGLLDARVTRHQRAVFVMAPGVDRDRPKAAAINDRLLLAGDWTASGWPATMEGAVRSGRLAVEAIVEHLGGAERLLSPDLPCGRLFRILLG